MLADANLENASPELVPAEEAATERTGLPLLLPATGSRAGAPETHLGQQSYPQAVNFANMSMHDGRNLSMAANFFSQTNVFHVHDENRARLRTELSFLEIEAERRHTLAMEEQARANEQGVSNLEELAERVHATRMASCEERFARFEQRSATRELGLIEELDEMQARFASIEQNVSQSEALLAQRMQEQYHQQLNSFAAQQSQFLLSEFEENFQVYQRTEREEFDAMLDAAKEQQDEIEDKLLATERALRFAEESQQQQAPVLPSAPSAPNVVTPNMLSSSMRGLLAQMNPGNTTAQQPQAGATAAPTWEVDFKGGVLIRHHRVERTGWFAPGSDCPINVRRLKSKVRVEKIFPEYPRFAAVAWNWRKTAPEPSSRAWVGKSTFKIEPLKVTFCDEPVMKAIPVEGDGFRHIRRKRRFSVAYATAEDCPKPSMKEQNRARIEAKQLEALVISMTNDVPTKCGYMCEDLTCESCERTPPPACSGIVPGLEFLADTGSEEDLISKEDLRIHYPSVEVKTASRPVSLITANGPVLGDQSVKVDIPELSLPVECYPLESTPPVCSVGRRCMDEGYDFHWHAGKVPFFVTPDGRKLKCKLKGRVPVIAEGSVATPAIEEESNIVSPVFSQGGSSLFQ